jgi:hypothetical protein
VASAPGVDAPGMAEPETVRDLRCADEVSHVDLPCHLRAMNERSDETIERRASPWTPWLAFDRLGVSSEGPHG